jgi:hypothetical protein
MPMPMGYTLAMHKVTRYVQELGGDERRVYEAVLGETLRDDQQVVIQVVSKAESTPAAGGDHNTTDTLPDWCGVYDGLSGEDIAEVEKVALQRSDLSRPS